MARLSIAMFIALNCLSLAFGFAAISWSAYLQLYGDTACQKALEMPLLVTGLFLLLVATVGLVGSCCRANFLLWIYLFVMFVMIVGLVVFTVFVLVVTNKFVGKRTSPDRLHDYSSWLQNRFSDGRNWEEIRSCLVDAQVCSNLDHVEIKDWSLLQSGCCKPPMYCGLTRKNNSFWVMPEKGPAAPDSDCTTFSSNQDQLCYDCNSCKGGVLAKVREEWRVLAILNCCVVFIFIFVFFIGCYVMKYNRHDKYIEYSNAYY